MDGVGRMDQFAWKFNQNGVYTVKLGYHVARMIGDNDLVGSSSENGNW